MLVVFLKFGADSNDIFYSFPSTFFLQKRKKTLTWTKAFRNCSSGQTCYSLLQVHSHHHRLVTLHHHHLKMTAAAAPQLFLHHLPII